MCMRACVRVYMCLSVCCLSVSASVWCCCSCSCLFLLLFYVLFCFLVPWGYAWRGTGEGVRVRSLNTNDTFERSSVFLHVKAASQLGRLCGLGHRETGTSWGKKLWDNNSKTVNLSLMRYTCAVASRFHDKCL